MKITTKQFAEQFQVNKLAAHGMLRCLVELGCAIPEEIQRVGKGRREIAYTLIPRAADFLMNLELCKNQATADSAANSDN